MQPATETKTFGSPMGSPISPGIADITMEVFEEELLSSCPDNLRPKAWFRYVDDTFTLLQDECIDNFTDLLNSKDENIQFTSEIEKDEQLAFLDACAHRLEDGSIKTTVYRKPTHTTSIFTGSPTTTLPTSALSFAHSTTELKLLSLTQQTKRKNMNTSKKL